jgi:hypothetical protein
MPSGEHPTRNKHAKTMAYLNIPVNANQIKTTGMKFE